MSSSVSTDDLKAKAAASLKVSSEALQEALAAVDVAGGYFERMIKQLPERFETMVAEVEQKFKRPGDDEVDESQLRSIKYDLELIENYVKTIIAPRRGNATQKVQKAYGLSEIANQKVQQSSTDSVSTGDHKQKRAARKVALDAGKCWAQAIDIKN